ncbi:MAG: helix-turn-helix domain-containing protein [Thermodesulfobacteriota bacterium]
MARKKIDESIRRKVLAAHAEGLPMRKIAKEQGVSLSSVSRIVKEEEAQGGKKAKGVQMSDAEKRKKIAELEKKIAELEKKIADIEAKYS